ncbi:DeoR family transcriptional regulator [Sporosarcina sp. NCCP-2716]|uniref:DeoR/GlpR family DNA-binding transcription regulator n=1 Tax=Sporosarcina sp. NCCP-2716 TaxID=2943679 RepID=UPI00203A39BD|nr:DeoR/GlpR family DNA-binding transcription regulator [Sporosarcina sp. NCCP-2716]GKV70048.1 DeoR family transcriptional regulator [Sporosarcina sp. NCCP-2716]
MLETERHAIIMRMVAELGTVRIQDLREETGSSESTIRRDLIELEKQRKLKRIHGGASKLQGKLSESPMTEKSSKNLQEKQEIAQLAASLVDENDTIYLDAGSTIYEMIRHLPPSVTVVTNGISHTDALLDRGCKTILTGGSAKPSTKALIGRGALASMNQYRFDKCFLGVNGLHPDYGLTTPDEEEASMKELAIRLSRDAFALVDPSKFQEVSFARFAELDEVTVLTTAAARESLEHYPHSMKWKVTDQ